MCNEIVGVNGDEGTPVPIPNTVVKLVYGDNTWLATAREDNSTPTSKAATKVAAFSFFAEILQETRVASAIRSVWEAPFLALTQRGGTNCVSVFVPNGQGVFH